MKNALFGIVLSLCMAQMSFASGYTVEMNTYWSASNVNASQFDLNIDVFEEDGSAVFTFMNESSANLSVSNIFFESGLSSFVNLASPMIQNNSSANLVKYGKSNNKAWYSARDVGWTLTGLALKANGKTLDAGEVIIVKFGLKDEVTIDGLVIGLTEAGSRIGVNAAYGGNMGAAAISEAYHTPTPTAAMAGLLMVGGLVMRRRREA
ncbi:hypothetical protein JD969_07820 [Planctomycetota bacterium]|nr:hypothetical protein JD969_07820 [Planctomycetota bacterium]